MKALLLGLILATPVMAQEPQEAIVHKVFVPTSFGIKSRTIDTKDAEKVLKAIADFKLANPKVVLTGVEILTCTSDYELPQNTVTNKKVDEHIQLAKDRHEMIKAELAKNLQLPVSGESKLCGPDYKTEDLNDRFVTKDSGVIFDERFKVLLNSEGFSEKIKEEVLIEDPNTLKTLYPSPFLAKFKPFQGVRVYLKAIPKEKPEEKSKQFKQPSGKSQ